VVNRAGRCKTGAKIVYEYSRNPLAHNLGLGPEKYPDIEISKSRLGPQRIAALEDSATRPTWAAPGLTPHGTDYVLDVCRPLLGHSSHAPRGPRRSDTPPRRGTSRELDRVLSIRHACAAAGRPIRAAAIASVGARADRSLQLRCSARACAARRARPARCSSSSNAEATRATGEAGVEYQPATGYPFVGVLELRSRGVGSGDGSVGHRRAERIERWGRITR
jgi:hypothetical protein